MVKLAKPQMSDRVFERTFSDELAFLSDTDQTFMGIKCRAGGWANPDLTKMRDEIQVWRQSKLMSLTQLVDDREKYATESAKIEQELGRKMFEAIYDACVVEWWTNIEDDGKPMICDRENFIALADVRIDEISVFYTDFAKYVDDLANFRAEIDKETAKN